MNLLITICARGGSKGIPGKNIKLLNGKPLIAYSIDVAKRFGDRYGATICLSTDNQSIKNVAADFSLKTDYSRPSHLADDKAGKVDTIKDVLTYTELKENKRFDVILDLDVTSPLRTDEDLDNAFKLFISSSDVLTLFSVNQANRNPYFNMVEKRADGFVDLVKKGFKFKSRQEAPEVYDMNASFYFYKRIFFDSEYTTPITERSLVYVVPHICFDLDHPHDFLFMEVLLREKLLGFSI